MKVFLFINQRDIDSLDFKIFSQSVCKCDSFLLVWYDNITLSALPFLVFLD